MSAVTYTPSAQVEAVLLRHLQAEVGGDVDACFFYDGDVLAAMEYRLGTLLDAERFAVLACRLEGLTPTRRADAGTILTGDHLLSCDLVVSARTRDDYDAARARLLRLTDRLTYEVWDPALVTDLTPTFYDTVRRVEAGGWQALDLGAAHLIARTFTYRLRINR